MNVQSTCEETLLQEAILYAKDAGSLIIALMNEPLQVREKINFSDLVTTVDVKSEERIRELILASHPDHWILSEETDGVAGDVRPGLAKPREGYGWIIDPIDGTINFVHRFAHFAISIGIIKDGQPIIGVVYNPVTRDLYTARAGAGAFWNGSKLAVGTERDFGEALVATGFQATAWREDSVVLRQIRSIAGKARNVRILGSASLDLCHVAAGRLTGFWHDDLYPWDVAAGIVIIREAGGEVTNGEGEPFVLGDDTLVASNGNIHETFLEALSGGQEATHESEASDLRARRITSRWENNAG